jgi:hypothetical protein
MVAMGSAGAALWIAAALLAPPSPRPVDELPRVEGVALQPVAAQTRRLVDALDSIGQPLLEKAERARLDAALSSSDEGAALREVQALLDPHCLFGVVINPESRVKVARGPAEAALLEQGWRAFLVKVRNEAGITAPLTFGSPNAEAVFDQVEGADPPVKLTAADVRDRWLDGATYDEPPLRRELSGLLLEYRIVQLFSRDAGAREATVTFHVGSGTADLGFRNAVPVLFHAERSVDLLLHVQDENGAPTLASFVVRDAQQRVYPLPSKRLAPDFFFQEQVYRADGETIRLPAGRYRIRCTRGPEYLAAEREITIAAGDAKPAAEFKLARWIHPAALGWYSGDHHVHAAGCAHYTDPSRGVGPADMLRHIVGENLDVGCVLSWGPCWYHQKSFFEGQVSPLSTAANLMRYDVEVSGFPSSPSGHLCLLGLTEDDYPGTTKIDEWPSFDLPVLEWGRRQGAVVGFSHSGFGLETKDRALPSFEIPRYDGIGANEYVVDVTHETVDFISAGDTPWPFELSIWYHTNNAGFRTKISGETDFPCISGDRVGRGRVYAKLDGALDYAAWLAAVKAGRSYVSEGRAHLIGLHVGEAGEAGEAKAGVDVGVDGSELLIARPATVKVAVTAAALLDPDPESQAARVRDLPIDSFPYWSVERARVPKSRRVAVEVVVNGRAVARQEIEGDGRLHDLAFDVAIERSSWLACRIFASAHTNPVYVVVGDRPIRASRRSVQWCLDGVDQCWRSKSESLKAEDRKACQQAYESARGVWRRRLAECDVE